MPDTGVGDAALQALDTIVVVRSFSDTSWRFASPFGRYTNPPKSLAHRLNVTGAKRLVYTHPGGNMPQWCVNRMFEMITRGELEAAMIAGGESLSTQKAAQRAGLELDWNEDAGGEPEMWGVATRGWNDNEDLHRMAGAIFAYPMIENSIRTHNKRTVPEHLHAMGELFSGFAAVAAQNPLADRRNGFSAEQIATVGPDNPLYRISLHQVDELECLYRSGVGAHPDVRGQGEKFGHFRVAVGLPARLRRCVRSLVFE